MSFTKQRLASADMGYAVTAMSLLGESHLMAASEGRGPAVAFGQADWSPRTVSTSPGGTMGFAPYPRRDDAFFMITGFYPIFKAEQAGIDLCEAVDGWVEPWSCRRVLNLPFVHRIVTVKRSSRKTLVAATVCGGKSFQDDWSKPGSVYVVDIPEAADAPWEAFPILEGLHRNHGMSHGSFDGRETVFVSADDGIFAIPVPNGPSEPWTSHRILDRPVSEIGFIDLDGDGRDELVTIEPFHGNKLRIYRMDGDSWKPVVSKELQFGHGLSVGFMNSRPTIVVGNRSGDENLVCFRSSENRWDSLDEIVFDAGSGSAGTIVTSIGGKDVVFTSNPTHAEYAVYSEQGED